jgi:UDP-N-acetyl-D-mannosaminuronic acid dehydrogenase
MSRAHNPYGDGQACGRILHALKTIGYRYEFYYHFVIGLGYMDCRLRLPLPPVKSMCWRDVNQHAVETINRGEIHIVEPIWARGENGGRSGFLRASTTPVEADAFLIAVPTPFKGEHEPDMVYVEAAAKSIAPVLKKGALVILESTSPVGATERWHSGWPKCALIFPAAGGEQADINIAYCPERVLPGQVMVELIKNDRVIGGMTPSAARASAVQHFPRRRMCGDQLPHRRNVQADGKQLPRRQYRLCE